MPEPVVLVLGAGVSGLVAARQARGLLPASSRIIAIDREAEATNPASLPWLMVGERKASTIKRQRARLARRGIEFVNAEVRQINPTERYVRADSREFHYDFLVIALGAEPAPDRIPGLAEAAHGFYSLESAERLAATLRYFAGGRVIIAACAEAVQDPTAVFQAALLLEHYFHARRIRHKVDLHVYTSEVLPLAFAGEPVSEWLLGLLAHRGIELHCGTELAAVDAQHREASFADGSRMPFQLLVALPPARAPGVLAEAGMLEESGWLSPFRGSLEMRWRNVFAAGDAVRCPGPDGRPLPRLAALAQNQSRQVAGEIAARAAGRASGERLDGRVRQFLEVGGGAAALLEGDLLAHTPLSLRQPSILWHWANLAQERYWLWRWL